MRIRITAKDVLLHIMRDEEEKKFRKTVGVVAKAINANGETFIFATQRGYVAFKGGWEFTGVKN